MTYLVAQIALWLVAATAVGFGSAWLVRHGERRRAVRTYSIAESEMRAVKNRAQQAEARNAALERDLEKQSAAAERTRQAHAAMEKKLDSTESRRRQLEEQLTMIERDLSASHASLADTDRKLQERSERATQLAHDGAQQSELIAGYELELNRLRKARELIEHDLGRARDELRDLRSDLDQTTSRLTQTRDELERALEQRLGVEEQAQRELADRDEQIGMLCGRIKELEPLEPLVQRLEQQQAGQTAELDERRNEVRALRERLEALRNGPDDLKRIKGIGRVLERRLHERGIKSFEDLATLAPDEARALGEELKAPRRIDPVVWIEQARDLVGVRS